MLLWFGTKVLNRSHRRAWPWRLEVPGALWGGWYNIIRRRRDQVVQLFVDCGRHVIEYLLYQAEKVLDMVVPRLLEDFCFQGWIVCVGACRNGKWKNKRGGGGGEGGCRRMIWLCNTTPWMKGSAEIIIMKAWRSGTGPLFIPLARSPIAAIKYQMAVTYN